MSKVKHKKVEMIGGFVKIINLQWKKFLCIMGEVFVGNTDTIRERAVVRSII